MEWIERLNKAINYIEEYITEEISYKKDEQVVLHTIFRKCLLI